MADPLRRRQPRLQWVWTPTVTITPNNQRPVHHYPRGRRSRPRDPAHRHRVAPAQADQKAIALTGRPQMCPKICSPYGTSEVGTIRPARRTIVSAEASESRPRHGAVASRPGTRSASAVGGQLRRGRGTRRARARRGPSQSAAVIVSHPSHRLAGHDRIQPHALDIRPTLTCGYGLRRTGWTPRTDLRIRRLGVRVPPSAPPKPQVSIMVTRYPARPLGHLA